MKCKYHSCTEEVRENPYRGHEPLFCSKRCKNKQAVFDYRKRMKQMYVDYLGGKCKICGYDKTTAALQFHHLDPSQKEFELSRAVTKSFDLAKPELDKCVLLCANCHAEVHQGLVEVSKEDD